MAFTDEEKLAIAKQAIKKKVMEVETWDALKTFVLNVTPARLVTVIRNAIDDRLAELEDQITVTNTVIANLDSMSDEVDTL